MRSSLPLLFARDDCIPQSACPPVPACNCAENETCSVVSESCNACATVKCVPPSSSGAGGGISKGAVAGAVIGALVVLGLAVAAYFWYRRRSQMNLGNVDSKVDVPVSAETVLSRPDPNEKPLPQVELSQEASGSANDQSAIRLYPVVSNSTINLDPSQPASHRGSVQSDPFTDVHSIQTASDITQSTNVIPIALVPHGSLSSPSAETSPRSSTTQSMGPARPPRSPHLNIRLEENALQDYNLEHTNVSADSFRMPRAAYTTDNASRLSYMTTGSNASSILAEAPQIVTPSSGGVRQVLGVAKAAVVKAPSTPAFGRNPGGLTPRLSKAAPRSPLAQNSYGPGDVDQAQVGDPFSDDRASILSSSSSRQISGLHQTHQSHTDIELTEPNRPLSELTQAGSIIGAVTSATRVQIVSPQSVTKNATHRMTHGRLVTTPSTSSMRVADDSLQAQQERALAVARAKAAASGLSSGGSDYSGSRRQSASTVASAGGDSLLESFTFVPPSPISSRPIRSPPRSPLGPTTFGRLTETANEALTSPDQSYDESNRALITQRQQQGLSTASGASALDGYTFHIEPSAFSATATNTPMPSSAGFSERGHSMRNAQRASLDTLALTNDLSAFPLNFDEGNRDSFGTRR